ncbi:MAG: hypothetical protein ABIJ08_05480 [Nanoarchaeota archaeon]
MAGSTRSLHYKSLKRKAGKIRSGTGINPYKNSVLFELFNCSTCPFRATELCFHGIKANEQHANKICSERLLMATELLRNGSGLKKVYDQEKALFLNLQSKKLFSKIKDNKDIDEFLKISEHIINLG